MGGLTSRPKAPTVSGAPAPVIQAEPVTVTASETQQATNDTENQNASTGQERQSSLLSRDRGRFGTIETSVRGLLGVGANQDQGRKTLLGE